MDIFSKIVAFFKKKPQRQFGDLNLSNTVKLFFRQCQSIEECYAYFHADCEHKYLLWMQSTPIFMKDINLWWLAQCYYFSDCSFFYNENSQMIELWFVDEKINEMYEIQEFVTKLKFTIKDFDDSECEDGYPTIVDLFLYRE